ncbi:FIST signal transduction protein [Solibacillus daqui]|uniref:FIST signal transduction protein n=1 Tax=Solibacillus daqui TaxID=2912187 RepID=UPI002365D162|nr:FIST N-terminal domain-containing protein [Solibacillus daqui]
MDLICSAITKLKQAKQAVDELALTIHKDPALLLFFASTSYSFDELVSCFTNKFPKSQIVGVTTTGEIGPTGFDEFSLSVQSYASQIGKFQATLMTDIAKYPIFERQKLVDTAKQLGIPLHSKNIENEGLAFVFPVGLQAGEEKMLSVVNSIFEQDGFPIFGGTAGDDAKFEATYVSVNGEFTTTGGAVIFIKPSVDFYIIKENNFESMGKKVKITKADPEKRIVYEMNGRPAAEVFAQALGVSVTALDKNWALHPLGRKLNNDFYNASPFMLRESGAIEFYCQVYEGTTLEILQPRDAIVEMEKTIDNFTNHFTQLNGVLACNCILRKQQFQQERLMEKMNERLKQLPNLCGFSSYGEQLNKSQLNQTMLLIGFGKLRAE